MAAIFTINSVFITGANRGLGLKLVEHLLADDNSPKYIFASYRNKDNSKELHQLATKNFNLKLIELDVTDNNRIASAFSFVNSTLAGKKLSLLINNAAIYDSSSIADVTAETMERIFRVNAVAPLMIAQKFLPLLEIPDKANDVNAAIINISSMAGSLSKSGFNPARYPYKSSKAALNMITKTLSLDLKNRNIAAIVIHPGWMRTDMGGVAAPLLPEEAAKSIINMIKHLDMNMTGGFYDIKGNILPW